MGRKDRRSKVNAPLLLFALSAAACGGSEALPAGGSASVAIVVETPAIDVVDEKPAPIRVEELSAQGFVVGDVDADGVRLVDLRGDVIARFTGFRLVSSWAIPGEVVMDGGGISYLLDVGRRRLAPLLPGDDGRRLLPQFQEGVDPLADRYLDVAIPPGPPDASGFWAYALPSPDGSSLLGQWTGECEVPSAFLLTPEGEDPRPVFRGSALGTMSRALGWAADGRALVHRMTGACGGGRTPGVYTVRPGRDPRLLLPLGDRAEVRMWGPA